MYKYEPSNQCFGDLYGLRIIQQKNIYIYIYLYKLSLTLIDTEEGHLLIENVVNIFL